MRRILFLSALASSVAFASETRMGNIDRNLEAPLPEDSTVRALSVEPRSRVRFSGGTFSMGATMEELVYAVALCKKEPFGVECADGKAFFPELPEHQVTLSPYQLDRTEVSVAAYRRCVRAGGCNSDGIPPGDIRFDRPNLPVSFVSWDDAAKYCAWAGGRLPTEAEWEAAARGMSASEAPANQKALRIFPWGQRWNAKLANHGSLATDETNGIDGYLYLAPIDAFPDGATPEGVLQLAGNVAEWVHDRAIRGPKSGYAPIPAVNPQGPTVGEQRIVRGGSYAHAATFLRGSARASFPQSARLSYVGFRCASDKEG